MYVWHWPDHPTEVEVVVSPTRCDAGVRMVNSRRETYYSRERRLHPLPASSASIWKSGIWIELELSNFHKYIYYYIAFVTICVCCRV